MPRRKNDGRGRIGGRQKGTPNKCVHIESLLQKVEELLKIEIKQLPETLKMASPDKKVEFVSNTLPLVMKYQEGRGSKTANSA